MFTLRVTGKKFTKIFVLNLLDCKIAVQRDSNRQTGYCLGYEFPNHEQARSLIKTL